MRSVLGINMFFDISMSYNNERMTYAILTGQASSKNLVKFELLPILRVILIISECALSVFCSPTKQKGITFYDPIIFTDLVIYAGSFEWVIMLRS